MKVTPGHSKIDYEIGQRHGLPVVSIITESGLLNENCGDFAVSWIRSVSQSTDSSH